MSNDIKNVSEYTNRKISVDYRQQPGHFCDFKNSTTFSVVTTGIFDTKYTIII